MPDQDILDMQYDLARDRGIPVDEDMASKSFLYFYAKYKKEREDQARAQQTAGRPGSQTVLGW